MTPCRESEDVCLRAQLNLGQLCERLARPQEATQHYAAIAAVSPRSPAARALVAQAITRWARLHERTARDAQTARHLYLYLVDRFPAEPAAEDALAAIVRLHDPTRPAELLTLLATLYLRHSEERIAEAILFRAAEVYAHEQHLATAIALYDALASTHAASRRRYPALFRAATLAAALADYPRALTYAYRLLGEKRRLFLVGALDSSLFADAQLLIGRLYLHHLHQPERAVAAFRALQRDFPQSRLRDDAQWGVAESYFGQGRLADGCAALAGLIAAYPNSNHSRRAQTALQQRCPP